MFSYCQGLVILQLLQKVLFEYIENQSSRGYPDCPSQSNRGCQVLVVVSLDFSLLLFQLGSKFLDRPGQPLDVLQLGPCVRVG